MKTLQLAQSVLVGGLVLLMPLFFLPITSDFFNLNKIALLVVATLLALLVWGLEKLQGRHFSFRTNPLDLPVFLFAAAYVAAAFVGTTNKLNAFVFPGMATVVLSSALFYFILVQYLSGDDQEQGRSANRKLSGVVSAWVWGVVCSSLILLLSSVGVLSFVDKFLMLPAWLKTPYFSTTGGLVSSIVLFIVSAPLIFGRVMQSMNKAEREGGLGFGTALSFIGFIIFVASTAFAVYQVLPGKPQAYTNLPLSTGWSIALEALKKPQSFFLGTGPGDFVEAFSRFRPVEYNMTSYWNLAFSSSSNWYLDVLTVGGVLSLGFFVFLLAKLRKLVRVAPNSGDLPYVKAALVTLLVVFLLTAATTNLVFAFFVLAAFVASFSARRVRFEFSVLGERVEGNDGPGVNLMAVLASLAALAVLIAVGAFGGKVYAADMAYRRSLNAVATQGKYKDVMDSMAAAITLNPNADFYRNDYSQVSLALMQTIASKKDLTDSDKNDISQLLQLAIAQGKAGVALNQNRSGNWANLAAIYRTLIPIVQGADQFTIQVYQQAIALEPTNPNLRIALGGVLYSLKNYDDAVSSFELAVAAKPDLANAHYNLAIALKNAGKTERAASEMQQTVALLKPGSQDYDVAKKELDSLQVVLKKKAEEASAAAAAAKGSSGEQAPLQAPQPVPSPIVTPKFELPGANPPATPTPTPAR